MRETPRTSRRDDDLAADDGQLLQIRRRVPKASVHKQRASSHCAGIEDRLSLYGRRVLMPARGLRR
jgi:hypothetical protein